MAELSQKTLGGVIKVLSELPPKEADTFPLVRDFWRQKLFEWELPIWFIQYAADHKFNWTIIVPNMFSGLPRFSGTQDIVPEILRNQCLRRLTAIALKETRNQPERDALRLSLQSDGFEIPKPDVQIVDSQASGSRGFQESKSPLAIKSAEPDNRITTPHTLIGAVAHIRKRFELSDFTLDFASQQKCYKELHPVTPGRTPSAIFKAYMDTYEVELKELIGKQFDDLFEIGLANADLLRHHPVEWAQLNANSLLDEKPERAKLWIKNACDQQPMSKSTTPEDMEEFVHWRTWRAPKFIVMQPSGNVPYDATIAWEREDEANTQKYLHGLSERFRNGLVFHLQRAVGEAYVKLAKKGIRLTQPQVQAPSRKGNVDERSNAAGNSPVAFISYSWDSEAHKKWVLDLATKLRAEGGVRIILDQWYLPPGGDRTIFMEKSLSTSKFVILICTPKYAERADNREGGVGYEATIITGELAENINQGKFIPVLRDGDWNSSLPVWIKTKVGIDLRNDPFSDEQYQLLLRTLHNESLKPPPVGPKPVFGNSASDHQEVVPPEWAVRAVQLDEDLTPYDREATRRKLAVARIDALHPRLTVWLTNRSDHTILVKSVSLWHSNGGRNHKRLSHGVPSDNRVFVELRPHTEDVVIAFVTDEDAKLKLQSLGVVEKHLAGYEFSDDVDVEARVEYDLLGVEDEYRETVRVRVHGDRQIKSL